MYIIKRMLRAHIKNSRTLTHKEAYAQRTLKSSLAYAQHKLKKLNVAYRSQKWKWHVSPTVAYPLRLCSAKITKIRGTKISYFGTFTWVICVYLEETICIETCHAHTLQVFLRKSWIIYMIEGVWHEIFSFSFFTNQFPNGPEYPIEAILNGYENSRIYSNVKLITVVNHNHPGDKW